MSKVTPFKHVTVIVDSFGASAEFGVAVGRAFKKFYAQMETTPGPGRESIVAMVRISPALAAALEADGALQIETRPATREDLDE